MLSRRSIVSLIGVAMLAAQSSAQPAATLHLPDMPLHDPYILADAATKTYFLYTSNNGRMSGDPRPGTMVYTSTDLLYWTKPTVVFTVPAGTWANPQQGPWAPEVHAYRGKFYLFTTLHNSKHALAEPPAVPYATSLRSTIIAVSDSPIGPFTVLSNAGPWAPADFMVLDGTLFIDEQLKPWMVYAHEWVQKIDGTIEAIPLRADLTAADGPPIHLFKASDGAWLNNERTPTTKPTNYVTDGPELLRTRDGHLLMLWSSYDNNGYVQTVARSRSGKLQGPWEELDPILRQDSGHGMLFRTFDDKLMLVVHRPFKNARGKLYEIGDAGDHLTLGRERVDLDGGDQAAARQRTN